MSMTGTRSSATLFAALAFGNFVIGMGAFVVIGIVTPIADGLGAAKADAGIVMTAYAFAYAIASPVAVAVTGRMSRRTVLAIALTLFGLGSVASALATSLPLLAASRVLVAIGGALFTPVAAGVAVSLSAPQNRGKALSVVFGGLTFAQVVGVPLGAWLAYRFGWQSTFWLVTLLAASGLVVVLAAIPRAVAFQASSLSAITETMGDWRTVFAITFTATFIAAIYMVFTFFGPLIEASIGVDPELRTLYLMLFGIGAVIGNFGGGYLTDRIGSIPTLTILCIAQAGIMPMFSVIPWDPLLFAVLVTVWSSFGWSFMAAQQNRLVIIAPQAQALALALNAAMIYVGIAIGSAASSRILGSQGLAALGIAGGMVALLALSHLIVSRRLSGT